MEILISVSANRDFSLSKRVNKETISIECSLVTRLLLCDVS